MDPRLRSICEFLEQHRTRATYQAVGEAVGISARAVNSNVLGARTPLASWIVNAKTERPTGYKAEEQHLDLYKNSRIIRSGAELMRLMNMGIPRTGYLNRK